MLTDAVNAINALRSQGVEESLLKPLERLLNEYKDIECALDYYQAREAGGDDYWNDEYYS